MLVIKGDLDMAEVFCSFYVTLLRFNLLIVNVSKEISFLYINLLTKLSCLIKGNKGVSNLKKRVDFLSIDSLVRIRFKCFFLFLIPRCIILVISFVCN